MTEKCGERLIIIGAGIAGLLVARACRKYFGAVTIVEREILSPEIAPRRGVPQGGHLHNIWHSGWKVLVEMFPELEAKLVAAGGIPVDHGLDTKFHMGMAKRMAPRIKTGMVAVNCTRPLLEAKIRDEVLSDNTIELIQGAEVTGLSFGTDRVTGVTLSDRKEILAADFVVDTSGRGSKTQEWLMAQGLEFPKETVINAFGGYTSRMYKRPSGAMDDCKALWITACAPDQPRSGLIQLVEGGKMMVMIQGANKNPPPVEVDAFNAFAASLPCKLFSEIIGDAEPLSDCIPFRACENRFRHYDKVKNWPAGFVALSDAVRRINPLYGQGIAVAAMEVKGLEFALKAQAEKPKSSEERTRDAARYFQTTMLPLVTKEAWAFSTTSDKLWPCTEVDGQPLPEAERQSKLMLEFYNLAAEDEEVYLALMQVMNLVMPIDKVLELPKLRQRMGWK